MFVLVAQNFILYNRLTLPSEVTVVFTSNNELHSERSAFKSVSAINLWAIIQVLRVAIWSLDRKCLN